jgi:hypothetical protein
MKKKMSENDNCTTSGTVGDTTTINRPIPAPRSRVNIQTAISTDENESKAYENIILVDTLKSKNKVNSIDGKMNNVIKEMNFLNIEKRPKNETDFLNVDSEPVPAPRIPLQRAKSYEPEKPKNTIYPDLSKIIENNTVSRSTGAIRKAPPVPGKLNNDLKSSSEHQSPSSSFYTDNDSLDERSNLDKSTVSTSSSSDNLSGKYKTSSPAELLGMLTKSITERITTSKKNATHKLDKNLKNTKTQLGSRMKNVREKITDYTPQVTFSLGRRKEKKLSSVDFDDDRPKTLPVNDEIFKNISFNSPLNTKTKMNNLQDLSTEADSTYEIPRSSKTVQELPSYDEVVSKSPSNCSYSASQSSIGSAPASTSTDTGLFERNSHLTQSLYSNVKGSKIICASPLSLRHFNRSENDVSMDPKKSLLSPMALKKRRAASVSSTSSEDSLPCPEFPAPVLETVPERDPIYGKIKATPTKPPRNMAGKEVPVEYRRKPDYENTVLKSRASDRYSNRATTGSNESTRIFSRMANTEDEYVILAEKTIRQPIEAAASASDSWAFYDTAPGANPNQSMGSVTDSSSSPEPFYANNQEAPYGTMCELQSNLLRPVKAMPSPSNLDKRNTIPFDLLDEFDPLINKKGLTMPMDMKLLNLLFLEEFLGEDTYGRTSESILPEGMVDSDSSDDSDSDNMASGEYSIISFHVCVKITLEFSFFFLTGPAPPHRSDSLPNITEPPTELQSIISPTPLRKKSEPTFDKKVAEAQKKSVIIHQNLKLPYNSMENILEDSDKALDQMQSNLPGSSKTTWFANNAEKLEKNNKIDPVNSKSSASSVEKVVKSTPKLPSKKHEEDYLPSYDESMADNPGKPEIPASPLTGSRPTTMKNMLSRAWKLTRTPSQKAARLEVKTIIEMLPKPAMTDRLISHGGPLLKLPSGVMEDLLKELSPRTALLRDKIFYTFQDTLRQIQKEQIQLRFVTSIQSVQHQKFNNDTDIHCFEINFALPKVSSANAANQALCSNPNMVMSTTDCGNIKTTRSSFIFAVYKVTERNLWMQKLLESMTSAFPPAQTAEYTRAGWCYMKKSVTSEWCGAWIVLSKRKLILHSSNETRLEVLDLRKMRCIGLAEADESIRNLHVEKGSLMLIDCPPYTMYFIMSSPRDTKTWRLLIKEAAHANGSTLKNQQLTKDNVPVLVDKCINFVYTHGSMSEGIYRKSGSATQVQKLLTLFKQDAFSLQLIRTEYNEHDVSSALKKFMRELPEPLIGKFSDSFIVVSGELVFHDKFTVHLTFWYFLLQNLKRKSIKFKCTKNCWPECPQLSIRRYGKSSVT